MRSATPRNVKRASRVYGLGRHIIGEFGDESFRGDQLLKTPGAAVKTVVKSVAACTDNMICRCVAPGAVGCRINETNVEQRPAAAAAR